MLLDTLTNETKIAPMGDMKKARPEVRLYQRTILGPVQCVGVGLHSGIETRISLRPAGANEGIVFRRTDVQGSADVTDVQAVWQNVIDSSLCTTNTTRLALAP
jgi:UDP-3-O-acyl-N-acetylglucosamine deacetylase